MSQQRKQHIRSDQFTPVHKLVDSITLAPNPTEEAHLRAGFSRGKKLCHIFGGRLSGWGVRLMFTSPESKGDIDLAYCSDWFKAARLADVMAMHLAPLRRRVVTPKYNNTEVSAREDFLQPGVAEWCEAARALLTQWGCLRDPSAPKPTRANTLRLSARLEAVELRLGILEATCKV